MDESISWDQKCKSSKELFKIKRSVGTIFDGVEHCKETIAKRTYFGHIDPFIQSTIESNLCPEIRKINADLEKFHVCLKEEMVADMRYFNSLELKVDSLKSQLETQKTQFLMRSIDFQGNITMKDFSKSKSVTKNNVSNDFSKPITAQILPPNKKSILKNTNVLAPGMYKLHTESIQTRTTQLPQDSRKTNKRVSFSTDVIPTTSVSRPKLKSNPMEDRVLLNNSQGKKQEVEDHHRNVKFSKNKTSVTACNDSLKAKTSNVNFVCATSGKCVLNDKHDMCVLKSLDGVNSRTKMPIAVPVSTREPKRTVNQSVAKPLRKTIASEPNQKPRNTTRKLYERISKACSWWYPKFTPSGYNWKPNSKIGNVKPNVSMPLGNASRTANVLDPMNSRCSTVSNTTLSSNSFVARRDYPIHRTVKFGNDQIAPILGYGDLGNDLLTGSRGTDLYSITLQDTNSSNLICLMAKATSSQAWLWHRRLSHLNFDTINLLSKNDIVTKIELALEQLQQGVSNDVLNDKKTFQRSRMTRTVKVDRTFFRCGDPNHLFGECPEPPKDKNQRAFFRGSWSDSGEEDDEKVNNETCLVAQASSEICLGVDLEPDEWIKDSGCSKHMMGNRKLFSSYKAYNGGNVIFGSDLRGNIIGKGQICDNKCRVTFPKHDSEITKDGKVIGRESLNVTFDETPPPSKISPLVDDDLDEEEAIRATEKKNLENVVEDETLEIDEIVNIKESRNHPLENVIGNLNQRTLSFINEEVYVAQPLGFIDFEKLDHVCKLKKALYGLTQALKAWYDRLKAFLVKHEYKMRMIDNTLFTKKKSLNLIIVQIYVDDIIFGSTCQDKCDEFAKIMHDEFEMSMMVYADSDHAVDYVDRKSTSGIRTFVGCCLTSWFSKKQTTLAISTTEAEYVRARKACQSLV
uniref:Retrovirus-related Pol polyprotein from transposon TNT 1-94 n=1 Tax=Tanacetum cinerariifolium TaxID=118510 RepID=A0A6L2K4K3_TANCI|nr:hypothetical protein [Tanacetum cinerariifolium]